jgi:hypothetical protein
MDIHLISESRYQKSSWPSSAHQNHTTPERVEAGAGCRPPVAWAQSGPLPRRPATAPVRPVRAAAHVREFISVLADA